jgi:hypothetical protein
MTVLRIDEGYPTPGAPWDQLPPWSPPGLSGRALTLHRRHWLQEQSAIIMRLLDDLRARKASGAPSHPV